ncbi:hypothetical protein [Costertonia aggregata]|uniref:Lipoprotein n=1 Tax=Costertonia aggregata TaxID=343403 RepID=A0A7H9APB6_9FLAO|nr:hypothetical protein [Costertonia aggregata]QLG45270.1 hypothetical protein HYG79_07885 [Costertonia aggregata]
MRKLHIVILGFVWMLVMGCSDSDDANGDIQGAYFGTFERGSSVSNVELILNKGVYTGESETAKFPAICNRGEYSISSNQIVFTDTCIWTADFDWTLILGGSWEYRLANGNLTLRHPNGDLYSLKKK